MQARKNILLTTGLSALLASASYAGPNCGALIKTNLTLQSDLGPCSGDGLVINSGATLITINLNGHHISGAGMGSGLHIGTSAAIKVIGPGQIEGFETGVSISSDNVVIFGLALKNNTTGVAVSEAQNVRVVENTIVGNFQSRSGISTGDAGNVFLYQNTITGHSLAGIELFGETDASANENTIQNNGAGIVAGPADLVCFSLRGNRVVHNTGNGIDATPRRAASHADLAATAGACFDIEDNTVLANGGSGIVLEADPSLAQVLIQDNIVRSNAKNGISLSGGQESQVIGNVALGNGGKDMYYDPAASPGSCAKQNVFQSVSAVHPAACP